MSDLIVLVLKLAFLVLLWLFVLIVASVVRGDLRERAVAPAQAASGATTAPGQQRVPQEQRAPQEQRPPKEQKRRRGREPRVLAIDTGAYAGARLQLVDLVRIGRTADCELVLDDEYVSTAHASLQLDGKRRWVLTDAGSTNGTFVNEHRVTQPTVVTPADTIRIGRTQMRVEG